MNIHLDSQHLGPFCFGAFLLLFIVLLIIALSASSKRKQQVKTFIQKFNFTPLGTPPPDLMEAINTAYSPSRVTRLKNVYQHFYGDEQIYLLDIYSRSGSYGRNDEMVESTSLACFSPHLDLPKFFLYYRTQAPERVSGWIDSVVEKMVAQSMLKTFQDVPPEFDTRYALYVADEEIAARTFTPERLTQIAAMDGIYARGQGKLLYMTNQTVRQGGKLDSDGFSLYIDTARRLCDLLAA